MKNVYLVLVVTIIQCYPFFSSWFLTRPGNASQPEPVQFRAHEWNHFCFAFDAPSASARVIVNGEETNVAGRYEELVAVNLPDDFLDQ